MVRPSGAITDRLCADECCRPVGFVHLRGIAGPAVQAARTPRPPVSEPDPAVGVEATCVTRLRNRFRKPPIGVVGRAGGRRRPPRLLPGIPEPTRLRLSGVRSNGPSDRRSPWLATDTTPGPVQHPTRSRTSAVRRPPSSTTAGAASTAVAVASGRSNRRRESDDCRRRSALVRLPVRANRPVFPVWGRDRSGRRVGRRRLRPGVHPATGTGLFPLRRRRRVPGRTKSLINKRPLPGTDAW